MSRDDEYLLDILDAARLARQYIQGKTKLEFLADTQCQDAVIRRLEIIGEAARRLSDEKRAALPEVAWDAMTGMRNILVHEYTETLMGDEGIDSVFSARSAHSVTPAIVLYCL